MTSPEWLAADEDDADRFPASHASAQISTHGPDGGSRVVPDPARVARWQVAVLGEKKPGLPVLMLPGCTYDGTRRVRDAMSLADEERAALVGEEVERLRGDIERYRPLWSDPLAQPSRWRDEPNPHPRGYLSTHEVLQDYDGAIRCASNWSTEQRHAALDRTMGHVRPLVYEVEHLRADREAAEAKMAKVEALAEEWWNEAEYDERASADVSRAMHSMVGALRAVVSSDVCPHGRHWSGLDDHGCAQCRDLNLAVALASPPEPTDDDESCPYCDGRGIVDNADHRCGWCGGSGRTAAEFARRHFADAPAEQRAEGDA